MNESTITSSERQRALLTVEEVAQEMNVSDATIRRWVRDGNLAAIRVGGQWRIRRTTLDAVIAHGLDLRP